MYNNTLNLASLYIYYIDGYLIHLLSYNVSIIVIKEGEVMCTEIHYRLLWYGNYI